MSQLTALPRPTARAARTAQPAARRTTQSTTPRLRVVQAQDAAEHTGVGFVILCVLLLSGGLLALLLLNTNRAQESFAIQKLQATSASLTDEQQQLASEIDAQSAPQQLALRAQKMGLEPASKVRYVRKADGTVLGVAKRSGKDSTITVGTLPSTPASRAASAAVSAASSGLLVTEPKTLKVEKAKPQMSAAPTAPSTPSKDATKPATSKPTPSGTASTAPKTDKSHAAAQPTH